MLRKSLDPARLEIRDYSPLHAGHPGARLAQRLLDRPDRLIGLILLAPLTVDVFGGKTLVVSWPWIPQFGLELAFRLDG